MFASAFVVGTYLTNKKRLDGTTEAWNAVFDTAIVGFDTTYPLGNAEALEILVSSPSKNSADNVSELAAFSVEAPTAVTTATPSKPAVSIAALFALVFDATFALRANLYAETEPKSNEAIT